MDSDPPRSEPHELAKLSLEVMLGARGTSVDTYLDKRRNDSHRERIGKLGAATVAAGVDQDELMTSLESDDGLQELFEQVADTATRSRYDEKITYLGKVLANTVKGTGGAQIDSAWLRLRAVEDLEPMHVQLLWLIHVTQPQWGGPARRGKLQNTAERMEIDFAAVEHGIGLLRRHGLVEESPELDLEVDVEIEEPDKTGDPPSETTVDTSGSDVTVGWTITALGTEILEELKDGLGSEYVRDPSQRTPSRRKLDKQGTLDGLE